jgi:hypothetical protein
MKSSTSSGDAVHLSKRSDASVNIIHSSGRHRQGRVDLAPRLSLESQPISIVNQTIQDGVCDGWIREAGVPLDNGHLSGHQRRGSAIAIIQDLEQVLRLGAGQRISEPVIEKQELDTGEGVQELGIGAVGMGESGLVQEAGGALVADIEVMAASGVGQRASQEGLSSAM